MRMTVFWKRLGRAGGRPQSLISSARRLGRPWKTGSSEKGGVESRSGQDSYIVVNNKQTASGR